MSRTQPEADRPQIGDIASKMDRPVEVADRGRLATRRFDVDVRERHNTFESRLLTREADPSMNLDRTGWIVCSCRRDHSRDGAEVESIGINPRGNIARRDIYVGDPRSQISQRQISPLNDQLAVGARAARGELEGN